MNCYDLLENIYADIETLYKSNLCDKDCKIEYRLKKGYKVTLDFPEFLAFDKITFEIIKQVFGGYQIKIDNNLVQINKDRVQVLDFAHNMDAKSFIQYLETISKYLKSLKSDFKKFIKEKECFERELLKIEV